MENTKTNRKTWLSASVGFVADVATTLVADTLLMGGMMMGGSFCDRPNSWQRPTAEPVAQREVLRLLG